ncbi:MAG: PAS domain S-box protein [Actinobacteria bacterium]|nr:PAS domain S-box protein [Actinomycetota bacterium]
MRISQKKDSRGSDALRGAEENIRELRGLLGEYKDTTERLHGLEEEIRVFKDAFFGGVLIIKEGEIVDANGAAAAIIGVDLDTLISSNIFDCSAVEILGTVFSRVLDDGENPYDYELVLRDGRAITINIQVKDTEFQGGPAKVVSIMDTTRFRETEQRLREEKAFTDSILENLPDVFYVADLSGRLIKWNKAMREISGYSDEELAAKNVMDFITEEDIPRIMTSLANSLATGRGEVVETTVVTKNGACLNYEFYGGVFTDSSGNPIGISGIGRDVSPRKGA